MKEVLAVDGDRIHVLTSEDVSDYKSSALKWIVGGVATVAIIGFALGWRAAVLIQMVEGHEKWRPIVEHQEKLLAQLEAVNTKLDRAHNDAVRADSL